MPADEQQALFNNIAGPLSQVSAEIIARQLAHFDQADAAYGAGVRAALKHAASTWPKGDARRRRHYNLHVAVHRGGLT
jgi:catalase